MSSDQRGEHRSRYLGKVTLRQKNIELIDGGNFDVLVVGGGINGASSAAALAARGVSVALVEKGDFASVTSQESSNLVWGGFKYLQNYELPLVFKLCRSRNQLMEAYPTQIQELGFLATLDRSSPFPSWLAGIGTLGYWGIGLFKTKPPKYYSADKVKTIEPSINTKTASAGIEYADAYLKDNDARLVWSFVRSALDLGAKATNYTELTSAVRNDGKWDVQLKDTETGHEFSVSAKTIVNAAGPFVDGLNNDWEITSDHRIVYSKGIHLVVPKITDSERVLAFFDDTQRLFYVIPMAHRSVIGTTDTRTKLTDEGVTPEDRSFVLEQVNARLDLETPLTEGDIIAERCGVRPLAIANDGNDREDIDWTTLSRKHELGVDKAKGVITIFGGKLTDCLNIGDEIIDAVGDLGVEVNEDGPYWYGEPPVAERDRFYQAAKAVGLDRAPEVERAKTMAEVLWRRHGLAAHEIVKAIADDQTLAEPIMAESDLTIGEVKVMAEREMVTHPEDFLRRRTKLSLIHPQDRLKSEPGIKKALEALGLGNAPVS